MDGARPRGARVVLLELLRGVEGELRVEGRGHEDEVGGVVDEAREAVVRLEAALGEALLERLLGEALGVVRAERLHEHLQERAVLAPLVVDELLEVAVEVGGGDALERRLDLRIRVGTSRISPRLPAKSLVVVSVSEAPRRFLRSGVYDDRRRV